MADEVKPADSAQAPAGQPTGTPAATAAPAVDPSRVEIQRLQAELGIERKRLAETQRAFHASQAQLKATQSGAYQVQEENGNATGIPAEVLQATVERVGFFALAAESPDAVQYAQQIREVLSDPDKAARYANPDPYHTFRSVYSDLKADKLAQENAELRKQLEARGTAREMLKTQAVSSGVTATESNETITRQDIENMTPAEMEAKFGKAALLSNLVR